MITRMGLLTKASKMPADAFRRYWLDQHSRFGKGLTVPCRYQQNHVVEKGVGLFASLACEAAFDGFSQVNFPDIHTMRHAMTPEQNAAIVDDEQFFLDDIGLVTALANVAVRLPSDPTGLQKVVLLFRRSVDVTPERFQAEWLEMHAMLARRVPLLAGYTQNLILERMNMQRVPVGYEELPVDGIGEIWFDGATGLASARDSGAFATLEAHAAEFCHDVASFLIDDIEIVPWKS